MTQTTVSPAAQVSSSSLGRRGKVGKSRHGGTIAVGIALLAIASAGGVYTVNALSDRSPVLVAARDIQAGSVVGAADVRVADAAVDGVAVIPRSEMQTVIGQRAVTAVPGGTLLAPKMVAKDPLPRQGFRAVGLALSPSRVPTGLAPGRAVDVWRVASGGGNDDGKPEESLSTDGKAEVLSVSRDGSVTLVTIMTPDNTASKITLASSRDEVALVMRPVGG